MAPSREKVIQTAERFVARGKVEAAIREYRKVLADHPRDTNTLNRVGDLYARIERIDEAISLFTTIAEHYTDDGFFVKAIAIYKKIIKLDPTRLEIYERLAELYHRQGLVNEARTQYQVLADYYQKHGDLDSAVGICQRMLELEPKNPSHRAKLADLYQQQGKVAEAMDEYRTIAEQMLATDQPEAAARVYEKALEVSAEDIGFLTDAVMKLREAGHVAAAARLVAAAKQRNPRAEQLARLIRSAEEEVQEARAEAPVPTATAPEVVPEPEAPAPTAPAPEVVSEPEAPAPKAVAPEVAPEQEAAQPSLEPLLVEGEGFEGLSEEIQEAYSEVPGPDEGEGEPEDLGTAAVVSATERAGGPEVAQAPSPALPQPSEATGEGEGEPGEVEFDLAMEEVFVFDLEDDEPPASLVQPPPDMLDKPPGATFGRYPAAEEAVEPAEVVEEPAEVVEEPAEVVEEPAEATGLGELELSLTDIEEGVAFEVEEEAPVAFDEADGGLRIDADLLERTAAEVAPSRPAQEEGDLLTEAEVLTKYGLHEKALERLQEALGLNPKSLPAHALRISLYLDEQDYGRVAELAVEMVAIAEEQEQLEPWNPIRERLLRSGFELEGNRIVATPGTAVTEEPAEEEAVELEAAGAAGEEVAAAPPEAPAHEEEAEPEVPAVEAVEQAVPEKAARPPRKGKLSDIDATLAAIASQVLDEPPRPRARATPPPVQEAPPPEAPIPAGQAPGPEEEAAAPPAAPPPEPSEVPPEAEPEVATTTQSAEELHKTAPELAAEGFELLEAEAPLPTAGAAAFEPEAEEDTGTSWLDEVVPGDGDGKAASEAEQLFDSEEGFFDLAAELEKELQGEEGFGSEGLFGHPQEQSLEEIVDGFKRGVAEHLSTEDYETHFNLGIAYREMGLLDEAIGEFQLAAKDSSRLVDCCSMLGMCFLDKGLPELAIKWYHRGLEFPDLSEEDSLALLYDLGNAHLAMGEREEAYRTFVDIYGTNTNYRDVVAKLEELGH